MSVKMEDMFRKHLENHEVVPSDRVWERVEANLAAREERSGFKWYLAIAAGVALIFALSVLFTPHVETPGKQAAPLVVEDSLNSKTAAPFEIREVIVTADPKNDTDQLLKIKTPQNEPDFWNTTEKNRTIAQAETPVKRKISIDGLSEIERFTEGQITERPIAFIDPFYQPEIRWYVKAEAKPDSVNGKNTLNYLSEYAKSTFAGYLKGETIKLPDEKIEIPVVNKLLANINNPFNSADK